MFLTERILKVTDGKIEVLLNVKDGTPVIVTIEMVPKLRTLKANRYYFGAKVRKISEMTGMSKEDVHEYLKFRNNPKQVPDIFTGEMRTVGGSTKRMTGAEFKIFSDKADEILEFLEANFPKEQEYFHLIGGK
jgi:hypothetical protein